MENALSRQSLKVSCRECWKKKGYLVELLSKKCDKKGYFKNSEIAVFE